ncbi:hypothetical protein PoB_000297500, partial [Plakobranchus ocellatus]
EEEEEEEREEEEEEEEEREAEEEEEKKRQIRQNHKVQISNAPFAFLRQAHTESPNRIMINKCITVPCGYSWSVFNSGHNTPDVKPGAHQDKS